MNIAILGYDTEGKVSYDYFAAQGHSLTICDQNTDIEVPAGADSVLGDSYLDNLDRFDLLVRTAGMPPHVILDKNPGVEHKITTHINEFFKACPTKNIIGVTGTKGKGTTSTLITKMLEAAGKDVYLGGNIGLPPITFLNKLSVDSWVVLELSSYQLTDLKYSPRIATCLMVVPEHLSWHADLQDYYTAKSNLFAHQQPDDIAIYYADNQDSKAIVSVSPAQKIPYFAKPGACVEDNQVKIADQTICATNELKLLGEHNWQNVCAAITTVWQAIQSIETVREIAMSFAGLSHRLEIVRELNGVKYINDSFASTPDAAIAAIRTFSQPKVLIIGGFDRNLPIDHLAGAIADNGPTIKRVLIIGESAKRLAKELDGAKFSNYQIETTQDIQEIVEHAKSFTTHGDVVILSPGFASFDMFKNFEDRGDKYKKAVNNL